MRNLRLFFLVLLPLFGCLALLADGFAVLAAEPCMGVADIEDFSRVTIPAGIEHLTPLEAPGYYVRCEFRTRAANFRAGPSSAAALAWMAKGLRFLGPAAPGFFALRQIGFLCLALAALMIAAGLRAGLSPWLAALLLYVIVDPGYLFFFNSFYADGALFLALLGLAILFERGGHLPEELLGDRRGRLAGFFLLIFLLLLGGGSKMLFVLLPLVVLAALGPALWQAFRRHRRTVAAIAVSALLVQLLVFWNFFYGAGPRFIEYNNFHAVYGGILRVSSHPERVLERLEIPAEHHQLAREDAWTAGVGIDHPVHDHLRELSRLELLGFYLADPPALLEAVRLIGDDLLKIASHPRGTYPRQEGDNRPIKRIYGRSWQFSNLTRLASGGWRPAIAILILLAAARVAAAAWRRRWTGRPAALLLLLLFFFSQCGLAVLGEGFVNLHQHLVGARLALDFLAVLLLAELAGGLCQRAVNLGRPGLLVSPRPPNGVGPIL